MSIPETQLSTWSNQGATDTAQITHEAVRRALKAPNSPLTIKQIEYNVYLQGSYKNDTNIRGNSDVDVVVQLDGSYMYDISTLSESEKAAYKSVAQKASYTWQEFRADVLEALRLHFGRQNVTEGTKCLKLAATPGRLPADIVPCIQYRKYTSFRHYPGVFIEGMKFYTNPDYREVINYPKLHYHNGAEKNQSYTSGWYKPSTRMFKNARDSAITKKFLSDGISPSYFVECLLFNVPNNLYGKTYQNTYVETIHWLAITDIGNFVCQNFQLPLFGNTPEQWDIQKARALIAAWISLYKYWT